MNMFRDKLNFNRHPPFIYKKIPDGHAVSRECKIISVTIARYYIFLKNCNHVIIKN